MLEKGRDDFKKDQKDDDIPNKEIIQASTLCLEKLCNKKGVVISTISNIVGLGAVVSLQCICNAAILYGTKHCTLAVKAFLNNMQK